MYTHKELKSQGSCLVLIRNLASIHTILFLIHHSKTAIKEKISEKAKRSHAEHVSLKN